MSVVSKTFYIQSRINCQAGAASRHRPMPSAGKQPNGNVDRCKEIPPRRRAMCCSARLRENNMEALQRVPTQSLQED